MDIIGLLKSGLDVFLKVFDWKTGGRTKDENALRREGEDWNAEYKKALASGDAGAANRARAELRKLREQARSKST